MNKQCTGCVVSAGTHKPAEALHQIDEPQTQQPEALRLLQEYRKTMPSEVLHLWANDACDAMFHQHARIAELEAQLEAIGAGGVEPLRKPAAAQQAVQHVPWCPDVCPITGRKFFMWIEHWATGKDVPTYGGPYDSYTIPVKEQDGTFTCERYDHDAGEWMTEGMGWECVGVMLVDDQSFVVDPKNPRYMEIEEFATQPAAQGMDAATLDALQEAESVLNSINMGKQHKVVQADGDVTYWQREEWCKWAKDEVLPKVTVALAAQAKQGDQA